MHRPARTSSLVKLVVSCCLLLPLAATVQAADVVVVGDSWADFGYPQLAAKFPPGVSVVDAGLAGMTAQLAADTNYVNNVVALNLGASHVYMSLGGNDVLGAYAGGNGANAAAIVDAQLRRVLDQLFAQFPATRVVLPGYDFPNFEKDTVCQLEGLQIFGTPLAITLNPIFLTAIRDVQASVAASYPNVTAVDAFGTLQAAGGIPFPPNPFVPSPSQYMGGDGDCIHANSAGYNLFMGDIYDAYFRPIYGGGGCSVAGEGDAAGLGAVALAMLALGVTRLRRAR